MDDKIKGNYFDVSKLKSVFSICFISANQRSIL